MRCCVRERCDEEGSGSLPVPTYFPKSELRHILAVDCDVLIHLAAEGDNVAFEIGIGQGWRGFSLPHFRWPGWLSMAMEQIDEATAQFTWRQGRDMIQLSRAGEAWQVSYQTSGKLLGPRQCVYRATHKTAKFAAWDVMARVISASHDEDAGLQVALRAAQWMRRVDEADA